LATSSKSTSAARRRDSKRGESAPPSTQEPAGSGSSTYAIGALVLGALIAGLLYWKCSASDETKPTPPPVTNKPPEPTAPMPEFAPPPPPEEDAGTEPDAGRKGPPVSSGSGGGACGECGKGVSNAKLESAVASTAGLARGCYQRALRTGGAEGKLNVRLSIGPDGSVCGANVTNDTLGSPMVSQCVVGKLRSRSYPKPDQGCVVVNVPMNFEMKK
jgi:outer membrane biosynthesis protein TonB